MDGFADIGTALSKPQMYIGIIFGAILILGGIISMSTGRISVGAGLGIMAFGGIVIFLAWLNRRLIKRSRGYAAYMGARDLFSILR